MHSSAKPIKPISAKGYIASLDGFRAISVLLVISSHLVANKLMPESLDKVFKEFSFGELGVRIFFVISGFLITYLLLKERSKFGRINLKAFYIRRVLRIFPVFYFYLGVLAILNSTLGLQLSFLHFLSSALYIHNFTFWGGSWLIGHTWSLAVEEQFYLLWPAIFLRINKLKKISIWIVAILIGCLFRAFHYKFTELSTYFLAPFFMHADFLFSGCFIAFISFYHYEEIIAFVNRISPFFVYCAIFALWFFSKNEFHPIYDKLFIPVSGGVINVCISFLMVYFVFKSGTIGYRFLNLRVIGFIGRLSYSLYIWQQLFLSRYNFWWTEFPQNILFTFLAAFVSYRLVEKPFLLLKEKFKKAPQQFSQVEGSTV